MRKSGRAALPLAPLLHAYLSAGLPSIAALHRLPGLGPRFAAVLGSTARFLYPEFLQTASDDRLREALVRFYEQVVSPPLHVAELARRAGFVRHALAHLLHGEGPAGERLAACIAPTGAYRVPGLGPSFWSALLQGAAPARRPAWTPATYTGLVRLGLVSAGAGPAEVYAALAEAHATIRAAQPELTALHIDHFLSLLSAMTGRALLAGAAGLGACPVEPALRRLRAARPLRERLKRRGEELAQAQQALARALDTGDLAGALEALAVADPRGTKPPGADAGPLLALLRAAWQGEGPSALLSSEGERVPALVAATLHLRDPQQYYPFSDPHRQGMAILDEGPSPADPLADRYRLFIAACAWLRQKHGLHPLEVPDLLEALAAPEADGGHGFGGLCDDTFRFLHELGQQNTHAWMERQRPRYHFAVRGPLMELCEVLAARYVEPVLHRVHGWELETKSRNGRALTSICKNSFGRGGPYQSAVWITFCPRDQGRSGAQLFVRLAPEGVRYGLRLGGAAAGARQRLRGAVEHHADCLARLLDDNGALTTCRFGLADHPHALRSLGGAAGLRAWAAGRSLEASVGRAPGDALLTGEELVGDILLTFDRLLPLFACAVDDDPTPALARLGGTVSAAGYGEGHFCRETYLGPDWLRCARELLALKKQLILQGVPGSGKTHVARCLARLLTGGRDEAVRLVQFHPAYSYEEFVEGIKVRSVAVEGRHEVTYPVEDGLLCAFAAEAARHPAQPHVLLIDEINRGNLPRIFGELLYLLEYRGQSVVLPYSRRPFQLPPNLYLVATMNAADRSVAALDQALRRRFSFLDMGPDREVLSAWLRAHAPDSAARAVGLFERLNARLRAEAGPQVQIGHSYFMVPRLDESRLRTIWRHHVRPLLDDVFAGQPGRAEAYDALLETKGRAHVARE